MGPGSDMIDQAAFAELGIAVVAAADVEQRVPCPRCARRARDNALGVNIGTGVFHCFRCGWRGRVGTGETARMPERINAALKPPPDPARLESIWRRTQPLRGSLGEAYLEYRHCAVPPADGDLHYLPGIDRYPPSLCARITDIVTGEPISLHFTRLAADGRGKADTEHNKLLLSGHRKAGGCIRLWPDDAVSTALGLAEGIETALAAAHAFTPVWSCVDAGNLSKFSVLEGIEALIIFADNDKAGLAAANGCGQRWADAGREVRIAVPERGDVADMVAA